MGVLGVVGVVNGALGMLFPSAMFWGEDQLQTALTRGCSEWSGVAEVCMPVELPHYYAGLVPSWAQHASVGKPMSPFGMLALSVSKVVMITVCEASGYVGGAIYPVLFAAASMGSALGALPTVANFGGHFVYVCTAAAMAVGCSAMLNTHLFTVVLVLVLQANTPHGNVSSLLIALSCAVYVHYLVARELITPRLKLIPSQQARRDIVYIDPCLRAGEQLAIVDAQSCV